MRADVSPTDTDSDARPRPLQPAPALADALCARDGLTCVVGAGGKKTALYRLTATLSPSVLTATVRIPVRGVDGRLTPVVTDDPVEAVREADAEDFPLGVVPGRDRRNRYRGYDPTTVDALAKATDGPTLVKADGARSRRFKAPGEDEPRVPTGTDRVLPVVSVRTLGEALSEAHVHRPERVAALTDLERGDPVGVTDVAQVLAHPEGGLKGVPEGASVVPVLNAVDDPGLADRARAVARQTLARSDRVDRVVLTGLLASHPVVDVVTP